MKGKGFLEHISLARLAGECIVLLVLSVILAFAANAISPKGIALFGEWDKDKGVVTPKAKDDVVDHDLEIGSVRKAKNIYDSSGAVFVDARSVEDFREGHIKGAVSLPVNEFDGYIDGFKERYPEETYFITYCSGRDCQDSHQVAQYLFEHGYWNVSVFIDGFPAWKSEGYPIEESDLVNSG